ncbi:MAG: S41 family peptidase [Phycisphaerales bacterium JB050]
MPQPQNERPKSHFLAILLIVTVGGVLVARLPGAITARMSDAAFTEPVVDIAHLVDRYYYRDYDEEELRLGAIRGMLSTLQDPYTEYIPPSKQNEFDKVVRGEFVGIGAQIQMTQDGWLQIASPMDDSPALVAGLQAGDLVIAVDGVSTWQRDVDLIIADLTGKPGTDVRLTVERMSEAGSPPDTALEPTVPGELLIKDRPAGVIGSETQPVTAPGLAEGSERFDLVVTRDRIRTQTVRGLHRNGQDWLWMVDPQNNIAYMRISQFTSETTPHLTSVLSGLLEEGLRGLVLDLRQNAGGSLEAAIQISDLLLESGEIISVEGRTRPRYTEHASAQGTLPDFPIALLVDRSSASASEILAGALSDNGRAIVIGERTFGKGLVQAIVPLPSGNGQLKITEADYYLPSGRSLHRHPDSEVWGVDPTPGYEVPLTDEQLVQLWTIRREEEVLRPGKDGADTSWSDPVWIRERLQDPPLALAVDALQHKLTTGIWPDRTETVTNEPAEPALP